jgi:hypothetical protein
MAAAAAAAQTERVVRIDMLVSPSAAGGLDPADF